MGGEPLFHCAMLLTALPMAVTSSSPMHSPKAEPARYPSRSDSSGDRSDPGSINDDVPNTDILLSPRCLMLAR